MMPSVRGDGMRGLAVFISDIRNCKSKEAEVKRINKELANIRSKFKGDKTLDGYQKKKYVCKLLFIFLLGHDIDFGHMEAVNLLSSNKYTEKQIGYLFISVLVSQNSDLINLINQSIKNDLSARNPVHVSLALQCIANIGSKDMVEAFADDIPKLLVSGETLDVVKQSAALCLLRLLRTDPNIALSSNSSDNWTSRIIHLINDQHMGVVTASISLIEALAKRNADDLKGCVSLAISRLARIVTSNYTDFQDYTYYFVPAPWLSVKLIRLLQLYPVPDDASLKSRLNECLETILNRASEAPKSKKVQHSNAKNAVLFEAISLIIHNDSDAALLVRACNQLGQFLSHRETNLRYLALESMVLLATSEFCHDAIRKHQSTVISALKTERDVSVRQRAVDLLYAMCDRSNSEEIVLQMLTYLETADYSIREEMVLKVAILGEKYATDYKWYVDVILNLIRLAGDYVSEEVWYRVIQIVINRDDVQGYAAKTVFEALQAPACHENMVKVGGYILGEFGNLIAGDPRSSPQVQFQLLHSKYHLCSPATRSLLLTSYVKFVNLFPEMKSTIQSVWQQDSNIRSSDAELQQRASEYLNLSQIASLDVLATVLEEMPPYPEKETCGLLHLLKKKRNNVHQPSSSDNLNNGGVEDENMENENKSGNSTVNKEKFKSSNGLNLTKSNENGSADLLGLGSTNESSTSSSALSNPTTTSSTPIDNIDKFYCKLNGVLFEDEMIQIGVKSECRKNLIRVALFYGNKTAFPFTSFQPVLSCTPAMTSSIHLEAKTIDSVVEGGAQFQQMVNIEFIQFPSSPFTQPDLNLTFTVNSNFKRYGGLKLPVSMNKFLESTTMDGNAYFMRWKNLLDPSQESQVIFKAISDINDSTSVKTKLTGFGFAILESVDPNPDNFVGAGIVHTKSLQAGVLVRLEPNKDAQMYRLTIRSSYGDVAKNFTQILSKLF